MMERCVRCGIPTTHPKMQFTDGVCSACTNFDKRADIDWVQRQNMLREICDRFRDPTGYDCIIAVSGGKDSHFIVKKMQEMDMHPLLVTVTDSFKHTRAGTHNLRNLQNMYNHYTYTIGHDLFIKASRYAFWRIGVPLKYIEIAIYTIPYYLARVMGIPLVVFGENAAYEYGGVENNFYSANGYVNHLVKQAWLEIDWWKEGGITEKQISDITPHVYNWPVCIYMSYFYPWSSVTNLQVAREMGFQDLKDTSEWIRAGCIEHFEQIDSYGYVAHLWMRYPRMGFQRATDIATRRVREGRLEKNLAIPLINQRDHILDPAARDDFCKVLGYTTDEFYDILNTASWNKYYNKENRNGS